MTFSLYQSYGCPDQGGFWQSGFVELLRFIFLGTKQCSDLKEFGFRHTWIQPEVQKNSATLNVFCIPSVGFQLI